MDWISMTSEERLLAEQAVLNLRSLKQACRTAKHGHVLAVAEQIAVEQGRELTRRTLEAAVQAEAAEVEKKGRPREPAPAEPKARGGTAAAKPARSSPRREA